MILRTKVFDLCDDKYRNLSELARAMGISVSEVYRIRQGTRKINQKFILGAMQAFPERRFSDLFYVTPDDGLGDRHDYVRWG